MLILRIWLIQDHSSPGYLRHSIKSFSKCKTVFKILATLFASFTERIKLTFYMFPVLFSWVSYLKVNWVVEIYGPSPWMWRFGLVPLHLPWLPDLEICHKTLLWDLYSVFLLSLPRDFQEFFVPLTSIDTLVFEYFLCLILLEREVYGCLVWIWNESWDTS